MHALATEASVTLATVPEQAVKLLKQRLQQVEQITPMEIDQLVANLDHKKFAVREQAEKRLYLVGEAAKPALLRVLGGKLPLEMKQRVEKLLAQLERSPKTEAVTATAGGGGVGVPQHSAGQGHVGRTCPRGTSTRHRED